MDIGLLVKELLEKHRKIRKFCNKCGGWGIRTYPDTSTYMGGIGGCMITDGVCDQCWGSGDSNKPWPSHKEFYKMKKQIDKINEEMKDCDI